MNFRFFLVLLLPFSAMAQHKSFNISNYGAKADGETNNAPAIQKTINEANTAGGGTVIVPAGRFVTAPIILKSGVTLLLEKGAVLLGSPSRRDYSMGNAIPLITAQGEHDIAIKGQGTIDGQGKKLLADLFRMLKRGELKDATWQTYNPWHQKQPEERNRPKLIAFTNCKNINIKRVSIKNGIDWVQDYKFCENLIVDSIKVESNIYWNNDGIDIVDCKKVRITNSFFNADDDGICLKSEDRNHYCEDIYIADCKVRSSASAIKFGTASRGGFRHITIKNIEVYDTFRSAIAIESVDGGFLHDITIQDINAINTGNAIFIRAGHRNKDTVSSNVSGIHISNVSVKIPNGRPDKGYPMAGPEVSYPHHNFPCVIAGLSGHPVKDVTLENISVVYEGGYKKSIRTVSIDSLHTIPEQAAEYPEYTMFGELPARGIYVRHAENITLKNVSITYQKPDLRPACVFDDINGLQLSKLNVPAKNYPVIVLKNVKAFVKTDTALPFADDKAILQLK